LWGGKSFFYSGEDRRRNQNSGHQYRCRKTGVCVHLWGGVAKGSMALPGKDVLRRCRNKGLLFIKKEGAREPCKPRSARTSFSFKEEAAAFAQGEATREGKKVGIYADNGRDLGSDKGDGGTLERRREGELISTKQTIFLFQREKKKKNLEPTRVFPPREGRRRPCGSQI